MYTGPMPTQTDTEKDELKSVTERILASSSPKKLVVAGLGAGKTTLFRQLLDAAEGEPKENSFSPSSPTLKAISIEDLATCRMCSRFMDTVSICCAIVWPFETGFQQSFAAILVFATSYRKTGPFFVEERRRSLLG